MRLTIARGSLFESLSLVSRGLSSRSTLPILSGVLLSAGEGDSLVIQTTDLEVSIKSIVSAAIDEPGQAVLPGRLMMDIARSLPEEAVTIETKGDVAAVTCGQSSFTVRTLPADDFPRFPEIQADRSVELETGKLADAISHVSKAVSRDETRPILTGVLLVLDGPILRLAATDSYRLAVKEEMLENQVSETIEVVVPGRALEEAVKLSAESPTVTLGVSENQVVFSTEKAVFVTRRIEGVFPNYKQLLPKDVQTTVSLQREGLLQAVKRVSLLAQQNTPLRLSVKSEEQTLSLSARTQDIGNATEDLMGTIEGPDVEIAFNHSFLADGIGSISGETVTAEIVSSMKPGVLTSGEDEGFLYLLMPVRLS